MYAVLIFCAVHPKQTRSKICWSLPSSKVLFGDSERLSISGFPTLDGLSLTNKYTSALHLYVLP